MQHAHMALYVVAEPRGTFDAWLRGEAQPAPPPATAELERGQQVLLGSACEYCHTIAGTNASGHGRPRPDPPRERGCRSAPATIPNSRGLPRRLDPRPAAHQAGQQDARDRT